MDRYGIRMICSMFPGIYIFFSMNDIPLNNKSEYTSYQVEC